ncbi:unnamed protein product, partial [Ostreobium quekettii]
RHVESWRARDGLVACPVWQGVCPTAVALLSDRVEAQGRGGRVGLELGWEGMDLREEIAKSRRREFTCRIASQRAMNIRMREKVQASKAAFDRLKQGLSAEPSDKVNGLRRRWRGKRKVKRLEERGRVVHSDDDWDDIELPVKKSRQGSPVPGLAFR